MLGISPTTWKIFQDEIHQTRLSSHARTTPDRRSGEGPWRPNPSPSRLPTLIRKRKSAPNRSLFAMGDVDDAPGDTVRCFQGGTSGPRSSDDGNPNTAFSVVFHTPVRSSILGGYRYISEVLWSTPRTVRPSIKYTVRVNGTDTNSNIAQTRTSFAGYLLEFYSATPPELQPYRWRLLVGVRHRGSH